MIGTTEILIIILVAAILLFGGKKVGELARSLGKFGSEYKKGKMEAEKELAEIKNDITKEAEAETKDN